MPYTVVDTQPDCAGWATVKETADGYETIGCHTTKQAAIDQMVAVSLAEGIEPGGTRAVDLSVPQYIRAAARRGVELYEQGLGGDGLVDRTITEARAMARGEITEDKVVRANAWGARHAVDLDAPKNSNADDEQFPGAGAVAHYLWGINPLNPRPAREWFSSKAEQVKAERSVVDCCGAPSGSSLVQMTDTAEERELPPSYRPADSDDVPVMRPACASCEYFCVHMDEAGEPVTHCKRWLAPVEADGYCDAYEPREEEEESEVGEAEHPAEMEMPPGMETDEQRMVGWVSVQKDERRAVAYTTLEARAAGEGTTLIGYAAVWDTPSLDMGFTEYVARGAFTKTLKDGADVRLLVDHEGAPLARTKSGTLRLSEDDRGLRVEADLDPTNPLAQTVLSALRRGDMNQMSFAFRTIRDTWSSDRSTRELREVQLYDVSVVTFPAYEATVAEVRASRSATIPSTGRLRLRRAQIAIAQV